MTDSFEALVRELGSSDPYIDDADAGLICFHCRAPEDDAHDDTCLWFRAERLAAEAVDQEEGIEDVD